MKHLIFLACTLVVRIFAHDGICDTKDQYVNELKKTMDLCGILYWEDTDVFTVDKTKACVDSCIERAVELEKTCNQTNIGGDGDSMIIDLVGNYCKNTTLEVARDDNSASKVVPLLLFTIILSFF